jgi:hypothetical protein
MRSFAWLGVSVLPTVVALAMGSCGELDPSIARTLDGATVRFAPGALCGTYDAATYLARAVNPPPCDPTLVFDQDANDYVMPGAKPCVDWAASFDLPVTPYVECSHPSADAGRDVGVCRFVAANLPGSKDGCRPGDTNGQGETEGDRYCSALYGQLVLGGGKPAGFCRRITPVFDGVNQPVSYTICGNAGGD